MNEHGQVREAVSEAYARAVRSPSQGGGSCCGPVQKGVVVKSAGYTPEELEALPPEAVINSFGCGNPLAFSEVREGDVVLDLGSGAGIDILLAGRKVGPSGRAIGIDMTDDMIDRARENIARSGMAQVEVRKGIIEDLPVASSSVDWVISNCVINLSPEKPRVFAEIARVLKPGGRMLVSDIVADGLPARLRENRVLYNSCIAGAMSEEEYVSGLRRAGLAEVEVRERIVYDAAQLEALAASELGVSAAGACCSGHVAEGPVGGSMAADIARAIVGKVWSAKVYARKPMPLRDEPARSSQ